jgi:prepilin-type N-terminal cleavage/methylation domain-containing protein
MRIQRILNRARHARNSSRQDRGFTLIELIIVSLITPIIIGALAAGLVAIFSLQSSAANRLSDTGDSQVVLASYQPDVQSALTITTDPTGSPQCGTGTELLGMEWNLDETTGFYQDVVSYVEVANGSSNPATVNLVRQFCVGNGTTQVGPSTTVSSSILSYDLPANQVAPTVTCSPTTACANIATQYISTAPVTNVSFGITEPKSNYSYTMVATPAAAAAVTDTGSPITSSTLTSCNFATPGSGYYASTMCFVDFAPLLTGAALEAANTTGGCLEMSVRLPEAYTLYFCLNISGPISTSSTSPPFAHVLPTWTNGFLGNNINTQPFYTNILGAPALYQNVQGATNTVTFSNITVVNPEGVPATGWEATSADAESTDLNESITWNSNVPLTVIPNNQTGYPEPVGNACQNGTDLTGNGTTTVECYGGNSATDPSVGTKTGTAMVEAETPTTLSATMVGTGLEGITFGLMLS